MDPALVIPVVVLAVSAQQQRRRMMEEEEETREAPPADGAASEFKIVRSAFGKFRRQYDLRTMLAREAAAGWDLYEKLDDMRVRLRRPIARRAEDMARGTDPYVTNYGMSSVAVMWVALAVTFVTTALVFLVVFLGRH